MRVVVARERRKRGRKGRTGGVDKGTEGLEVPLRTLWCKARGGGGRLRQATETGKKEKKQEKEDIYNKTL
jgi:hypothetical protein